MKSEVTESVLTISVLLTGLPVSLSLFPFVTQFTGPKADSTWLMIYDARR